MYLVASTNYFCLPTLCERNTHFYLLHLAYVCIIKNIILRFSTLPERKVKNASNLRNESWKIMLEIIAAVNKAVNDFIWGVPAMVCIIGVGLLLSFRTRFLQIRKFPYAMRTTAGRMFRKKDASDAVSGCMHGAGRHSGHGQHCRCGGRYCDRRPGRGILDVVFRTARYVHKVCGSYVGGAFS